MGIQSRTRGRSTSRMTGLFGTASVLVMSTLLPAQAQPGAPVTQVAQVIPAAPVEEVLITGSLIHGAEAIGVPVTALGADDFRETGAVSISDLLRTTPDVEVVPSGAHIAAGASLTHSARVNVHGLGFFRTLVLYDGMRYPPTGVYADGYDPEIIPSIAVERVDVLGDGASATYGSDAISGVVNIILRRRFEGAITQGQYNFGYKGGSGGTISQLYGKKWDSGDVTVSATFFGREPIWAKDRAYYTFDYTPWGLDNRIPLSAASPAIASTGAAVIASAAVNPFGTTGAGCTNCFNAPRGTGPTTQPAFSAFTQMTQTNNNLLNPWTNAQVQGPETRAAATITFDQRVTDWAELFVDAFYATAKRPLLEPAQNNPWNGGVTSGAILPTINPYYPVGAPAGLRVNFSLTDVDNPNVKGKTNSVRWDFGFNLDLPYDWNGRVFYANSHEDNRADVVGAMNNNNILAALGQIVGDPTGKVAPYMIGTAPRVLTAGDLTGTLAAYTAGTSVRVISPSTVPFLNPFCDFRTLRRDCVSPALLNFITAYWVDIAHIAMQQVGTNFDGPVFDLPSGPVRVAVGGSFVKDDYAGDHPINTNTVSSEFPTDTKQSIYREVYSLFGQTNVPLLGGDAMHIPLIERLDFEGSVRYDHYSDFGGTTNFKLAANWMPIPDLTLRSAYGSSFRAPSFNELSPLTGKNVSGTNLAANQTPACPTIGGSPVPGSAGAILNPTCTAALNFPRLASMNGGVLTAYGVTRDPADVLQPEKAYSFSTGFTYAPTMGFLQGLFVQGTYFQTIVHGYLGGAPIVGGNVLQDPNALASHYILVRNDPADPGNVKFNNALAVYVNSPFAASNVAAAGPTLQVLQDAMVRNLYRLYQSGIDWSFRYDFDAGNLGTFNAGINGTTYLKSTTQGLAVLAPVDDFDDAVTHTASRIRTKARAQLGWAGDNGFSVTGFVNYSAHRFYLAETPPIAQLRALFCTSCNTWDFQRIPAQYTFDLTLGYDTGDRPASDYLKGLHVQLTAVNLLNRKPPFAYKNSTGGGGNLAFEGQNYSPAQRVIAVVVTKNW
jgi:iron complex outermembrane receptor protein